MANRDDELTVRRTETDGEGNADTAALRAEISETRERMGDTIEQIGERLNPTNLKAQVKDDIREATIGRVETMAHNAADRVSETRRNITDTIRENPIPAAMVGIGLGWLFINGRRHNGPDYDYGYEYGRDEYGYGRSSSFAGGAGDGERYRTGGYQGGYGSRSGYASGYGAGYGTTDASGEYGRSTEHDEGRMHDLKEKASELGENVKERASELGENISEGAHHLAERTQDVYGTVADTTRRQARRVEDSFYENPLLVGALALSAGLAIGLAMPRTQRESRMLGEWRDDLVDKAKEYADETKEKVQHVAERTFEEAKDTAREAAEDEGLTR